MSVMTAELIRNRIASATEFSPIAVFSVAGERDKFNALFASTAVSQLAIAEDRNLIGVYVRGETQAFNEDVMAFKQGLGA